MSRTKLLTLVLRAICLAVFLFSLNFVGLNQKRLPVLAQSPSTVETVIFAQPDALPGDNSPPTGISGGGRPVTSCGESLMFTTLVPQAPLRPLPLGSDVPLLWGTTTQENPTFWFYLPYNQVKSVEFKVLREGVSAFSSSLPKPESSGIISASAPIEEEEVWYEIKLSVEAYCPSLETFAARAWVRKRSLVSSQSTNLSQMDDLQQALFYAHEQVWYDALTATIRHKINNSDDSNWNSLLTSVGLEAIASEPILDCCTSINEES